MWTHLWRRWESKKRNGTTWNPQHLAYVECREAFFLTPRWGKAMMASTEWGISKFYHVTRYFSKRIFQTWVPCVLTAMLVVAFRAPILSFSRSFSARSFFRLSRSTFYFLCEFCGIILRVSRVVIEMLIVDSRAPILTFSRSYLLHKKNSTISRPKFDFILEFCAIVDLNRRSYSLMFEIAFNLFRKADCIWIQSCVPESFRRKISKISENKYVVDREKISNIRIFILRHFWAWRSKHGIRALFFKRMVVGGTISKLETEGQLSAMPCRSAAADRLKSSSGGKP